MYSLSHPQFYFLIDVKKMLIIMVMKECPKCGSSNIGEGLMCGTQVLTNLCFYSTNDKSFSAIKPDIKSWVCLNCGYLESYADKPLLEKLEQKLNK